jgi:hypothetical protein
MKLSSQSFNFGKLIISHFGKTLESERELEKEGEDELFERIQNENKGEEPDKGKAIDYSKWFGVCLSRDRIESELGGGDRGKEEGKKQAEDEVWGCNQNHRKVGGSV